MAKKNDDVLSRFASAGNNAVGMINRVDDATAKFQPGQRKGSIVKSAQGNVFEFPVFISNSIPLDYATATVSLLEQIYAAYLQMAVSINPVIDADSVKNGLQFADYKTNTNKYLEYTDTSYQHDACHAIYQEDGVQFEFNMLSIEDRDARFINEAVDHQPLSEFDHFFQEAKVDSSRLTDKLYPMPRIDATGNDVVSYEVMNNNGPTGNFYYEIDPNERWGTIDEVRDYLVTKHGIPEDYAEDILGFIPYTMKQYALADVTAYDVDKATNQSDKDQMMAVRNACSVITPDVLNKNANLLKMINDLDSRYPGFADEMNTLSANVKRENDINDIRYGSRAGRISATDDIDNQRDYNQARLAQINAQTGNRNGRVTYAADIDNQRDINAQKAARARSRYYNTMDAINTGAQTAGNIAGAVNSAAQAVYNVGTLGTRISNERLNNKVLKDRVANLDTDRAIRKTEVNAKAMAKAPQYVDDSKCQKLNTMKPLLMSVTVNMLNKDDSLQPINYIIGVKTHSRVIPASILPEVARYPLKEMDKIARKIKWRAGEMKFLKDLVFRIKEKKQTAADSRDPNRKWYRRLYELAHMKGDAPAAAVVQGKSIFATFIRDKQGKGKLKNGMIPNASIIMSQADVDNIKNQTEIDLLKASNAVKFCGELFLISLIIVDMDAESIKIMLPDQNNDYDVHSLASVQKQLASLDTSGARTRDMFKLLG